MPRITVTILDDNLSVHISQQHPDHQAPTVEVSQEDSQVAIPLTSLSQLVGFTRQFVPRPPDCQRPTGSVQLDPTRPPRAWRYFCGEFCFEIRLNEAKTDWEYLKLSNTTAIDVVKLTFKEYLTLETVVDNKGHITALCRDDD